jgi:hypothetical protein
VLLVLALALGLSGAGAPPVAGQELPSRGPLRIAERNPLYHLFLTPTQLGADLEPWQSSSFAMALSYSNVFEYNDSPLLRQRFDVERLHSVLTLRHGIGPRLELGLQVGVHYDWGGFLDPLIQGVHTTFGFPNANREKVEDNRYRLLLESGLDPVRTYLDLPAGPGIEAPQVLVAWQLSGGPQARHAVALRSTIRLPLGDHRATTRRVDTGIEVAVRRSWARTHLHASAGAVTINAPPRLDALMRGHAWLGSLAVEQSIGERLSLLAQVSGSSSYTRPVGFAELSRMPVNVAFGAAGTLAGWGWQFSFAEDLPPNSPAVDFTIDLQISRGWPGRDPRARSAGAPPGSS